MPKGTVAMYAKTGILYPMPRHISKYGRPLPYFMKYRSAYYSRQKLSNSNSNMNRLCRDIEKWDKAVCWKKPETKFDHTIMMSGAELDKHVLQKLDDVYKRFCSKMAEYAKYQFMCRNYDKYKNALEGMSRLEANSVKVNFGKYYQEFKDECTGICADKNLLADYAVKVCYDLHPNGDKKFMWVVAEEGLLDNIKQVSHLIPCSDVAGEQMYLGKPYSMVEYNGGDS